MAILTARDQAAVRAELEKLAAPVKLVVFGQRLVADSSAETEQLCREVAECSDRVALDAYNLHIDRERAAAYQVDRAPAVIVEGARDYGIRFFGMPAGYEFSNLIDGMLVASSGVPQLSPDTLERLRGLDSPVHIQVFSTPT
jgi:alkyl hydroperoxide reductase subunit AhpF